MSNEAKKKGRPRILEKKCRRVEFRLNPLEHAFYVENLNPEWVRNKIREEMKRAMKEHLAKEKASAVTLAQKGGIPQLQQGKDILA